MRNAKNKKYDTGTLESNLAINISEPVAEYGNFFDNKMLLIHSIRRGFTYNAFDSVKQVTPFSDNDWAEYLNLSLKTLQRHKKDEDFRFKPIHTEKIIELAEVTQLGNQVFGDTELFYKWLQLPSMVLGNMKPAELLKDSYGKEMVMAELNRIELGIFA